jgi:hypothetical protein
MSTSTGSNILAGFSVFLKYTYTSATTITIERSELPRQYYGEITGITCTGPEHTLIFTAIEPIRDREYVKLSRTCKLFHVEGQTYNDGKRTSNCRNVWNDFCDIVELEVFAMKPHTSLSCTLVYEDDRRPFQMLVEYQDMQAKHGLTGAPLLDSLTGTPLMPKRECRQGLQLIPIGEMCVLPFNRSNDGVADSRTGMVKSWMLQEAIAAVTKSNSVWVIPHP